MQSEVFSLYIYQIDSRRSCNLGIRYFQPGTFELLLKLLFVLFCPGCSDFPSFYSGHRNRGGNGFGIDRLTNRRHNGLSFGSQHLGISILGFFLRLPHCDRGLMAHLFHQLSFPLSGSPGQGESFSLE
eukprot:7768875-Pyramimonas_sp.AAC.1